MEQDEIRIEADLAKREADTERLHALSFAITNGDEYKAAVNLLKELSAKSREIDEKRKSATRPLDEAKAAVLGWWRPAVDNLQSAISTLRKSIAAFDSARAVREHEVAAAAAKALVAGKPVDVAAMAEVFDKQDSGVRYRTSWQYEIVDAALVPREYMQVNEVKIGTVVRALKDDCNIPGVRVSFTKTPY